MPDINMIQIHELNEASSVAATDVLAIDTGDATLKLKASKMTTSVKGNAESSYRTGNVNLTPANIGAMAISTVVDVAHGGTGATTLRGLQTVALYNTSSDGITAYPTEAGLYRVTQSVAGLPSGASYYGVLMIVGAGTYYMHVFVGNGNNVYVAYKSGTGAPAAWLKVTGTSVTPIS